MRALTEHEDHCEERNTDQTGYLRLAKGSHSLWSLAAWSTEEPPMIAPVMRLDGQMVSVEGKAS